MANEDFGTPKNGHKRAHKNTLEPKILSPVKTNLLTTEETPSKRSSMPKSFIKESMRRLRESSVKKISDGSPSVLKLPGIAGSESSFVETFKNQMGNDLLILDEIRIPFKRASVASMAFDLNNSETRKNAPETPTLA